MNKAIAAVKSFENWLKVGKVLAVKRDTVSSVLL